MIITDEAKKMIYEGMKEKNADGVRLVTVYSCCGTSLNIELVNLSSEDKAEDINGIKVIMDTETRLWTKTVTIDAEDGGLKLINSASCC